MTPSFFEMAAQAIRNSVRAEAASDPLEAARLVAALERRTQRKGKYRRLAVTGACMAIAAGAFSFVRLHRLSDLSYRVGSSTQAGVVGSYVSAPATQPLDLHFSEGSQIVLQPRTRVRVTGTNGQGATMVLEDGRARADIVHRANTNWRIFAGPYVVGVTGTSFEVSYGVTTQTLELDMKSGVVRVWGPGLVNPVEVRDTQRFVLAASSSEGSREPSVRADASSEPAEKAAAPGEETLEAAPKGVVRAAPVANPAVSTPVESWSRLSARGEHRRIVELAEQQGVVNATATASRPDLFALGNSARFAGKPALAIKAYRAVRERFPNSPEASGAAFFLGRLSESSNPAQAIGWYEQYVEEGPNGAWVADALGRRMVILNGTSGRGAARTAATEYLKRFPHGPYAGYAGLIMEP